MTRAYLGLGSNLGDRLGHLKAAVSLLDAADGVEVAAVSSVYRSEPVGPPGQGEYLNAVVAVDTSLSPAVLLSRSREIEEARGRRRGLRWGPRTLDIDILLFGSEEIDEPDLQVPHPRLATRRFVLDPLLEIAPDARLTDGTRLSDACSRLDELGYVIRDASLVIA